MFQPILAHETFPGWGGSGECMLGKEDQEGHEHRRGKWTASSTCPEPGGKEVRGDVNLDKLKVAESSFVP